jgi:hypothetical protein
LSFQIARKQAQLPEPIVTAPTLRLALLHLRRAQHTVRDLSRKAFQLKNQHRTQKAEAIANSEGINAIKALERIQRADDTQEMF